MPTKIINFSRTKKYKQLAKALSRITKALDADRSTLFLYDKEKNKLVANITEGLKNHKIEVDIGVGVSGKCAKAKRTINVKDSKTRNYVHTVDKKTGYKTKTILSVPLMAKAKSKKKKLIGVIQVLNKKKGHFTQNDIDTLKMFSNVIALTIDNDLFE